jgi:hypothetical protein
MRCEMVSCTFIVGFVHVVESIPFFSDFLVRSRTCRCPGGLRISIAMRAQSSLNLTSSSHKLFLSNPSALHPRTTNPIPTFQQMLVPPRINEAAAYASIRRESNMRPTRQHSPAKFLRQSFQRLSRFVDRQQGRGRAISQHPLRTSIISSETSISDSPLAWESDARSVTTFGSSETLDNDAASSEQLKATEKPSLRCVNAEKFSRFVGGKETELALSSTLQKIGVDIDQIDIHLRNGQRFSWRKQKGIIELPPVIRKEIWRKAIVHDRKLFICSCLYVPHLPNTVTTRITNITLAATVKQMASSPLSLLSLAHLAVSAQRLFPSSTKRTTFNTRFPTQAITALAAG